MKKKAVYILAILVSCITSNYGQFAVGIKSGININDMDYGNLPGVLGEISKSEVGVSFGVFAEKYIYNNLSVVAGTNYLNRGFRFQQDMDFGFLGIDIPFSVSSDFSFRFIDIPVSLKYTLGSEKLKGYVLAGGGISHALSATIKPKANSFIDFNLGEINIDLNDNLYNRTNWFGTMGIGAEYNLTQNDKILVFADYTKAFDDLLNIPVVNTGLKNTTLSLGIGYALFLGS